MKPIYIHTTDYEIVRPISTSSLCKGCTPLRLSNGSYIVVLIPSGLGLRKALELLAPAVKILPHPHSNKQLGNHYTLFTQYDNTLTATSSIYDAFMSIYNSVGAETLHPDY